MHEPDATQRVPARFGKMVLDGWYEATPGVMELRGGLLYGLEIDGRSPWNDPGGGPLTGVRFVLLDGPPSVAGEVGRLLAREVTVEGGKVAEARDLGEVRVLPPPKPWDGPHPG